MIHNESPGITHRFNLKGIDRLMSELISKLTDTMTRFSKKKGSLSRDVFL